MKYFLDTEFLEGSQKKLFGKTKPTIDLVSIGIIGEDGREYYTISKDFNLKEAWNRFDYAPQTMFEKQHGFHGKKIYWIRENVLKPIYDDLWKSKSHLANLHNISNKFTYSNLKRLIRLYGKSNKQIAIEVRNFIMETGIDYGVGAHTYTPVDIYTYYGDYDWVVFCWLFGKMIDLPKGFPMYSRDLKQILDEKAEKYTLSKLTYPIVSSDYHANYYLDEVKGHPNYPKQENEHNALADARWNKKLYEFLKTI